MGEGRVCVGGESVWEGGVRGVCMGEFEGYVCGSVVCGCEGRVCEWGGNRDREHVSLLILSAKKFSSCSPIPLSLPPSSLSLFSHTHW